MKNINLLLLLLLALSITQCKNSSGNYGPASGGLYPIPDAPRYENGFAGRYSWNRGKIIDVSRLDSIKYNNEGKIEFVTLRGELISHLFRYDQEGTLIEVRQAEDTAGSFITRREYIYESGILKRIQFFGPLSDDTSGVSHLTLDQNGNMVRVEFGKPNFEARHKKYKLRYDDKNCYANALPMELRLFWLGENLENHLEEDYWQIAIGKNNLIKATPLDNHISGLGPEITLYKSSKFYNSLDYPILSWDTVIEKILWSGGDTSKYKLGREYEYSYLPL